MFFTPRDVPPPFRSQWISPYPGTARLWHVTNRIPARRAWSSKIWAIYSCPLQGHKVGHVTNMTNMTTETGVFQEWSERENVPDRYSNSCTEILGTKAPRGMGAGHFSDDFVTRTKRPPVEFAKLRGVATQIIQLDNQPKIGTPEMPSFTIFCWVSLVSSDFGKLWYHFTSKWFWLIPSLKLT